MQVRAEPSVWAAMLRAAAHAVLLIGCGTMLWHSLMQRPAARPDIASKLRLALMQYACLQPGLQRNACLLSLQCWAANSQYTAEDCLVEIGTSLRRAHSMAAHDLSLSVRLCALRSCMAGCCYQEVSGCCALGGRHAAG